MNKLHPRPYLLLELLVALTLVTLCILPFVNIPSRVMREEVLMLQRIDLQRLGDISFGLIQEKLYTNEIPWEQVCAPRTEKALVLKDIISLSSQEGGTHRFERKCHIYSVGKKGNNQTEHRLTTVVVSFRKVSSPRFVFFRKKTKKSAEIPLSGWRI